MDTTYTTPAAIDPAWLAELTAELATYGYKVTKARATRATSTTAAAVRPDGCTPTKAPKGHERCAAHWKVPGMRKPVCIVPAGATIREDGRDTGESVPDAWTDADTALAFAVDVTARKRSAGSVLRELAERERATVHATHTDESAAFAGNPPGSLAGVSGANVDGRGEGARYVGAPDCWRCEREYRGNAAGTPSTEPSRYPSGTAGLLPESLRRGTYDAEKARKVTEQRRMRTVPHAFAARGGYTYATECETCTGEKGADVHRVAAA